MSPKPTHAVTNRANTTDQKNRVDDEGIKTREKHELASNEKTDRAHMPHGTDEGGAEEPGESHEKNR